MNNHILAASTTPFVRDEKRMKVLSDLYQNAKAGDSEAINKFQKAMKEATAEWLSLQHDSVFNPRAKHVAESTKEFNAVHAKNLGGGAGQVINIYESYLDELKVDSGWMRAYRTIPLSGVDRAEILDFTSLGGWEEIEHGHDIEVKPWGTQSFSEMREKRHAIGRQIYNRWLETGAMHNINTVYQTISSGRLTYMANKMYAALGDNTSITPVTSTGSTLKDTVNDLNSGAQALLKANSKKGFSISTSTPILVYYRESHGGIMDDVRNLRRDTDGNSNVNRMPRFNFQFIETYNDNFPTQPDGSNNGVMLVLPGLKNIVGSFKGLQQQTQSMFGTDSVVVKAQEYWNHQEPAAQRKIVNLA